MKKFKFTIDGNTYSVNVKNVEGHNAEVEVNGKAFNVTMEQEVSALKTPVIVRGEAQTKKTDTKVATNLPPTPPSTRPSANTVNAPLPGSIIRLEVNVGDTVKQGDVLLVMESMKMENNILSERNGVIKSIAVSAGQAVLQDDVLLEIE